MLAVWAEVAGVQSRDVTKQEEVTYYVDLIKQYAESVVETAEYINDTDFKLDFENLDRLTKIYADIEVMGVLYSKAKKIFEKV